MSTALIIGSEAARQYLPNFREPKDFDLFTDNGFLSQGDLTDDGLRIEPFWHESFKEWLTQDETRYATLDELYTLKVSHSYWELPNGSWDKHMADVVLLKQAGAQLDLGLHKLLYKVWEEKHGKKKVNLQQDKMAFFEDAVRRIYDHDSIHYSVAYGERPIYETCFKDGPDSVEMDMAKIKALPFEECIRLFREEIYATALERWVIPANYRVSPRLAYARAVKKTITSLTKGWSARFLVENYAIIRAPDMDYVKHHKSKSHLLIALEK
jgi:hypothetical protein